MLSTHAIDATCMLTHRSSDMIKRLVRDVTPPFLWRAAAALKEPARADGPDRPASDYEHGVEQPPSYYDATFRENGHWSRHYTESRYFPLWTVVADRVRRSGSRNVLDVGCGPGQVACLLRDRGLERYHGIDFSPERVSAAREACPEFEFDVADVFAPDAGGEDVFEVSAYDCVLVMEFLEHVERDREVLGRIRPGTFVLATVPNFPAAGHVRHFDDVAEVEDRYGPLLTDVDAVAIQATKNGKTYYLLEGRSAGPLS